ncbi:MAG: hypothetical protein H0X41_13040 [Chitinophagaceae bacterium]|nr:hypothetical protein [Chitinophagaceae bacterium]
MKKLPGEILRAGVIVGTLDILSAFVYVYIKTRDIHVFNVLKFIASGLFASKAFAGGSGMMVTGLLLHYLIAFIFTAFFYWIFPKLNFFAVHRYLTGVLYGIFIWMVMNLAVVPLSNVAHRPFVLVNVLINVAILIVFIGLPLAYMAGNFYSGRKSAIRVKGLRSEEVRSL